MKTVIITIAILLWATICGAGEWTSPYLDELLDEFDKNRAIRISQQNRYDTIAAQNARQRQQQEIIRLLGEANHQTLMDNLGMSLNPRYDGR